MRRLGFNESPTAEPTRHGLGSLFSKLIAVAFAALLLFFLGTAPALADGVPGETTDSVLNSGQTGDSVDSRPVTQVTEPVTDLVAPGGRDSQDAVDDQASPADDKMADLQRAEPTTSKRSESDGAAVTDLESISPALQPTVPDEGGTIAPPANEASEAAATTGSLVDRVKTVSSAVFTDEAEATTGSLVDRVKTVPSAIPADSAGGQATGVTNTVSQVTEAAPRLIDQVVGDVVSGGDVVGVPLHPEVGDGAAEIVGGLTKPLEDEFPAVSSSLEQARDLPEVTVGLIATSVDAVGQASPATRDDLLATADRLVRSTTGVVGESLAGSPTGEVIAIVESELADEPEVTETGLSPAAPKAVVPALVDRPRPHMPRPPFIEAGITGQSPSAGDAAKDARWLPPSTTPGHGLFALQLVQGISHSGSAERADTPASPTPPAPVHSSNASPSSGLFFVLAALGLLALRLSRWLRLQPISWPRHALVAAIDRPG